MDNRYWSNGCPALMQDARFITNYARVNVYDQFIRNGNEIKSAAEYKEYLQKNGDSIINKEREYLLRTNSCNVTGKCLTLSGKGPQNTLPGNAMWIE